MNDPCTMLMTSCGQEWQFHIASDIWFQHTLMGFPQEIDEKQSFLEAQPRHVTPQMAIAHCYGKTSPSLNGFNTH